MSHESVFLWGTLPRFLARQSAVLAVDICMTESGIATIPDAHPQAYCRLPHSRSNPGYSYNLFASSQLIPDPIDLSVQLNTLRDERSASKWQIGRFHGRPRPGRLCALHDAVNLDLWRLNGARRGDLARYS
ncbi:hypothetical protein C8Q76DRAFT_260404 [Earliella scabrosa]|nr:hypothetical protein C8Q76DRAFT_260404 [Earliella scabrosa]